MVPHGRIDANGLGKARIVDLNHIHGFKSLLAAQSWELQNFHIGRVCLIRNVKCMQQILNLKLDSKPGACRISDAGFH
jgi:hypothetical protein